MTNPQASMAAFGMPSRLNDAAADREENHYHHHFPHHVLRKLLLRGDSTSLPPPPSSAPMAIGGSRSAASGPNSNHTSKSGGKRNLDCSPMLGFTQSTTTQTFSSDCYKDPFQKTRGDYKGDGTREPPPPWNKSHSAEEKSKITSKSKVPHVLSSITPVLCYRCCSSMQKGCFFSMPFRYLLLLRWPGTNDARAGGRCPATHPRQSGLPPL